jgi:hypothetical protein
MRLPTFLGNVSSQTININIKFLESIIMVDEDNAYSDDRFKKFYIDINGLTAHIA